MKLTKEVSDECLIIRSKTKITLFRIFAMNDELSECCKKSTHLECTDCACKCHIPGTMEYMSRNIARLEKERPGVGDSLPGF